jgi:hypothetical protein
VLGGGWSGSQLDVIGSYPAGDAWVTVVNNLTFDPHILEVFAVCARLVEE